MMLRAFYILVAIFAVLNGMTMLLAPETWYEELVPGVEHTGPMNTHFERDIGLAFLAFGLGLAWAAFHLDRARPIHVIATIFLGGHGILHVYEIVRGHLPAEHWILDAAGVFLPAALMIALCVPSLWRRANPAFAK